MGLTKKAVSVIHKFIRENKGKAYGSLIIEKLKGGVIYKVYFEMIGGNEYSKYPAYIKLVLPSKEEIIIYPLTDMEQAFKKSNQVGIIRYEFEKKPKNMPRYVYIFRIGNQFFDLPEELAKKISKELDIKIQIKN
jgi:hypothetical protein